MSASWGWCLNHPKWIYANTCINLSVKLEIWFLNDGRYLVIRTDVGHLRNMSTLCKLRFHWSENQHLQYIILNSEFKYLIFLYSLLNSYTTDLTGVLFTLSDRQCIRYDTWRMRQTAPSGECELTKFRIRYYVSWCIQAPCSFTKDF